MTLEQAANFFTSSILIMLALVVICLGAIAINYLLHKFWRPVRIFTIDSWNFGYGPRFIEHSEAKEAQKESK